MKTPDWVLNLKKKWNIESNLDFILIMIVFSIAGMSIVYVRKPLFHLFGITATTPFWIKFVTWLLIVFPTYQINLIIYGFLLGQFKFFWEKEKQMGRFFLRLLSGKKNSAAS
jgi:hypothetical protein